ncbi:hypothetical protein [Geodermatophilus ruber]|uniref:hypothetical protein n=1 Tax=Geodermatophilus ruber TaxID=504800 RepID=UPI0015A5BBE8|nr:hypothetical protein [Geodermatophilus ruber]
MVAFGLQVRGLPRLHGDGRRAELGEHRRRGLREHVASRTAPWSERVPAMTPAE